MSNEVFSKTLAQAIRLALANNPEIAATEWDVTAAQYRHRTLQAGRWPSLSIEGGFAHYLEDQRLIPTRFNGEPGIFDRDIYRGDLVLKLPLFTGGRLSNEIRGAELLGLSEERRLARTREEKVFNRALKAF